MGRELNIQIIGVSGSGKSKLGDLIRTQIFKMDEDSRIVTSDPDRENKTFGAGKNLYNIGIEKVPKLSSVLPLDMTKDVVVILTNDSMKKWFEEVYES